METTNSEKQWGDVQIDNSLMGMIVDMLGPLGPGRNNGQQNSGSKSPPLNPTDIDTEGKVGNPERDTNKKQQEISTEKTRTGYEQETTRNKYGKNP
jgi:hypothetical protein